MPTPSLSVIIPTYNRERVLARALDSVLAQTFESYEVLVVDDESKDGTSGMVAEYAGRDSRIRYLRQPQNGGVSAARNRGIREARAEFIAFLDSDDEWLPTKLEQQVDRFRKAPGEVGLVYCGVQTVSDGGDGWTFSPEHRGDVFGDLLLRNVVHTGSGVMIRRAVVDVVGLFDEGIPAAEDYEYWIRIARHFAFDFVTEPLLRYHDVRMADRKSLDVDENAEARDWIYRKHRADMADAGVAHHFLLESGRRELVYGAGDRRRLRRLAVEALRVAPLQPAVHRFAARHLLPSGAVRRLQGARDAFRSAAGRP